MRIPGSIYVGKEGRKYLAMYTFFSDICRAAPPSARDSLHVAHVDYSYESFRRGIDVFLLNSPIPHEEIQVKRSISTTNPSQLGNVDVFNDVKYEVIIKQPNKIEALNLIRQDIFDFCEKPARKPTGTRIEYLDLIKPKMELRVIHPKFLLMGGKQEFVPTCNYEANFDFSYGCPSGMVNGFLDIFAECPYCYAIYNHKTFSKYIVGFDKEHLKEELLGECYLKGSKGERFGRPVKVLRLGKRTESGSKFTLDSLILTLETCIDTGTRAIMPTKYLEFNKEIANLFKKSNSVVLYSIGDDRLERGACSHGCTNEYRLEQAVKYKEAGVNSVIYLLIDLPHKPREREENILKFAKEHRIKVQLLPIRIGSKDLAREFTGISWDNLKKDTKSKQLTMVGLSEGEGAQGGYLNKAGTLIAQEKDQFWKTLVGDNKGKIRMCHHDEKETYCGRCFLSEGFINGTEHIEIKYAKFRKGNWKKRRENKNLKLFEINRKH